MKAKQLLKFLSKLSKEDLNKEVVFVYENYSLSGVVKKVGKAPYNLLWDGEDDPSQLKTRNAFIEDGYAPEDVDMFTVEIEKGSVVINI